MGNLMKKYQDAVASSGTKKYRIGKENGETFDATMTDITPYTVQGTSFGAEDVLGGCLIACTHTYSGGVHSLASPNEGIENIKFTATADFHAGDTFKVNGALCTARTVDGRAIADGHFAKDAVVIAQLNNGVLYFGGSASGGGGGAAAVVEGDTLLFAQGSVSPDAPVTVSGYVSYEDVQSLNDTQKRVARDNIGASTYGHVHSASAITYGTLDKERLPFKYAWGTTVANSSGSTGIDYSSAKFTGIPVVIAGYSSTGSWSGVGGVVKVHSKTTTMAKVTVGGSSYGDYRDVDWIAFGV